MFERVNGESIVYVAWVCPEWNPVVAFSVNPSSSQACEPNPTQPNLNSMLPRPQILSRVSANGIIFCSSNDDCNARERDHLLPSSDNKYKLYIILYLTGSFLEEYKVYVLDRKCAIHMDLMKIADLA